MLLVRKPSKIAPICVGACNGRLLRMRTIKRDNGRFLLTRESVMPSDYTVRGNLNAKELFSERLEASGLREHMTANRRCLTDGQNYLWVYMAHDGTVSGFVPEGPNAPRTMVDAISQLFNIPIFSDRDPQYWGFGSQEEWDAAENQASKKRYDDLCAFVRGDADGQSSANGEIAKVLVGIDASLLQPENKGKLLAGVDAILASVSFPPW
jgi:hypothetical protein